MQIDASQRADAVPERKDQSAPVRVGLIVESENVPAYVAEAVRQVALLPRCDTTIIVLEDASQRRVSPRLRQVGGSWLYETYRALDRALFRGREDPLERVALVPTPGAVIRARVIDAADGRSTLADRTLDELRAAQPDVLVAFGGGRLPNDVMVIPRHGVWTLDGLERRGAFFWPLAMGDRILEARMVSRRPDGHLGVVYRSVGPVDRLSEARTERPTLWKAAQFAARGLANVSAMGWTMADLSTADDPSAADQIAGVGLGVPSARTMAGFLARLGARIGRRGLQRIAYRNEWFVAFRRRAPDAAPPTNLAGFTPIEAPAGHFYADPFIVADAGAHRIFVEDFAHESGRGSIGVLDLVEGRTGPWKARTLVERPFHLSYPFVHVEPDGSMMLIPESGDHGVIERYRPIGSVARWEVAGTVMSDISAYDPTIAHHGGRYWLFAAVAVRGANPWDELFVFSAPTLDGPWAPHPSNPVVSDVRCARPAGRLFVYDGRLVRPAQDCSGAYGRRVVLQEIVTLDESRYEERPWTSIEPDGLPRAARTHCYTFDDAYEVVDAFRLRRRGPLVRGRR